MAPPICGGVISLLCVVVMMSQPLLVDSYSNEYSFTFKLPPGKEQCFYEDMKEGESLELEYQVIEGGELDVNFKLRSPSGEIVSSDDHQMDGLQSYEVKEAGGYAICFDNSFSSISHKMIFVDLIIDTLEETPHEEYISADATMSPDDMVHDMKVIDIRNILNNVTNHLNKVEIYQLFFRAREARHRYTLESNMSRVLWWSVVYVILIMGVSIGQVMILRSLFRNKRADKITT